MDAGIWGFIGVIIGAFSSIVTTVMVARSNRLLQKEASSFEREEMRREFQRNNLIELQDILTNIMRLVAHIASSNKLAEDSNHKIMTFNQDINVRIERITDDSLRESLRSLQYGMTAFLLSEELTLTNELPQELVTSFKQEMENIGVALRSY
jgi:uncharacterized membrane protein YhiD involved in acid resistance